MIMIRIWQWDYFQIGEFDFWKEFVAKGKISDDEGSNPSQLPFADLESNVYNFGIVMLEIITGKLPYSEEQGFLVNWVTQQKLFV